MHQKIAACLLTLVSTGAFAQASCSSKQSPQEIDARLDALIAKMTLSERIAQLQDRAPAIPRLGLPSYNWWSEGLHGAARDGYATVFPQAIGLAATWNPVLLHAVGDTVASEARAKFNGHGGQNTPRYGGLTLWSPNVNIFRDPRWGRGQETYGEDPFLTATLGTQFVEGLQGSDSFYLKADATPKHFAAHSGPERGRDSFNAVVSPHDFTDTYLPAFQAVTTKGHAAALMCSYNEINGTPSCGSRVNLQDLVRDQWGFQGYVVSDCDAVDDITEFHHYTADNAHGAADALNAGVDLDCGNTYDALQASVTQKLTTEAQIDRALHRLLRARVRLGMMDAASCSPFGSLGASELNSPAHRALALRAAEESIVLLKNNGVLPLSSGTKNVAVIGPTADMLKVLEANYHGTAVHPVTPLEGLQSMLQGVHYAQGSLLAEGVSAPVPRTAYRTAADGGGTQGLGAEYFDLPNFDGAPALTAKVDKIDLDLDRVGPVPSITAKQYAVRWSGSLVPPAPGEYVLRVNVERCWDCTTHDSFRLFVDGKLLLDNHGAKADPGQVSLHFADLQPHALRLELLHTGEDEGIALEWIPPAQALLDEAVHAAEASDVVVAFVGLSPDLEGEALQVKLAGFDGGDRTSLDLPETQQVLLQRLRALGKPLVIVLTSGSAVNPGPTAEAAAAMLEGWYPGEAGGVALAEVLTGKVNTSGRLPVTFYRSATDLPPFSDYSMAHRTYRYFDGPVLYPFGFGLSYSEFVYGAVHLEKRTIAMHEVLTATVNVRNRSSVRGTTVAELYLQPPQAPGAPRLTLQGLQKIDLQPGEARELSFAVTPEQMSTVDAAGTRAEHPGRYTIFIGGTQPDPARGKGTTFSISGR
ncbi:MAG: glycoside hydrolase family 3 C-terminal domain-containing protein [Janthinobacterium lividum]